MKNLPFSDDMSERVVAGAKTVTRRVVNPPKCARVHGRRPLPDRHFRERDYLHFAYTGGDMGDDVLFALVWPRYQVGEPVYLGEALVRAQLGGFTLYRRDDVRTVDVVGEGRLWTWKPRVLAPRFCPFALARSFAIIESVRAEQLSALDDAEARLEGFPLPRAVPTLHTVTEAGKTTKRVGTTVFFDPMAALVAYWSGLHGGPFDPATWVWRYALRPCSRDEALEVERERRGA